MTVYDEPFLTKVFDSVAEPFAIYDRDFRIVRVNAALTRLFDKTKERIVGRNCFKVFYDRAAVCQDCHVEQVFVTGEPQIREK